MENCIREILKDKGMTAAQLSILTGISTGNLSLIIRDRVDTKVRTFERIAKALEVPLGDIFRTPKEYQSMKFCPYCGMPLKRK